MAKKKTLPSEVVSSEAYVKDFFDMVVPSTIKFNVDHFVCGDSFRCVWAIKEYPPNTTDQAILSRFGDKEAVTLHMYTRFVDGLEQRKILQNASRKNKMLANSNDLEDSVMGEGNLYDVVELMNDLRKNREPLLHCAVFLELSANSLEKLRELQADISMEMTREKLSVDRLTLRQKEGFIACMPCGHNVFGTQFERVLPASAVANCYPFNYSGKTDPHGFYLGRDKFGTNIIVDFDGYLIHERLIDRQVLNRFVKDGLIYEDADYHNAVFVGKNSEGIPVHAQKRATSAKSDFKGNVDNSIAEYSFHFTGTSEYLFVFEAPIDMLAYISMHKQGWENHSYVALCSTSERAALQMLKDNPHLKTVYLCLDNDNAGLLGCKRIADSVHALGDYTIWRVPPQNKDWDEDLKALNGQEAIPASGIQPNEPESPLDMTM